MTEFVDLSRMPASVADVRSRVEAEGRAWVIGRPGTGRSTLANMLLCELPDALRVDLPPMDADAAIHGLLQAASGTGDARVRAEAEDGGIPFAHRVATVAKALASAGIVLVVNVPWSWSRDLGSQRPAEETPFSGRARVLLERLLPETALRVVVITAQATDLGRWRVKQMQPIHLPRVHPYWDMLLDEAMWGPYSQYARAIHDWFEDGNPGGSPIALRMAVGLLALGGESARVKELLPTQGAFLEIGRTLVEILGQEHREIALGIRRVAQSRYPLPLDEAQQLAGLPRDHGPLLTQCMGYGAESIRVNDWLRERLIGGDPVGSDPDTHFKLSGLYASRDGVASAAQTASGTVINWLERVHHLGLSGPSGENDWRRIAINTVDQIWDRARSLSREHREYRQAADLYRRCTELEPAEPYSWHYLGYNLERAGADRSEAEYAYRRAIEIDPANPWWNGRYVRSLVYSRRFRAAAAEWDSAKRQVLSRWPANQWLAENFHLPVIHAWLKCGRSREASKLLGEIEEPVIEMSAELRILRQRVNDAEESDRLGESLYPPEFPMCMRWRRPPEIPDRNRDDKGLLSWHPARVVGLSEEGVQVVFATTDDDFYIQRVLAKTLPADDWELAASEAVDEALEHRFYFIGVYEGGGLLIRPARRGFFDDLVVPRPNVTYEALWRGTGGADAGESADDM